MASFERAMAIGADSVELDLNVTADGVIVVWHDRDPDSEVAVARQSGLEGFLYIPLVPPIGSTFRRPVDDLTAADFFAHYGYTHFPETEPDQNAPIASFDEFLSWAASKENLRAVYLDVKVARDRADQAAMIHAAVETSTPVPQKRITWYFLSVHESIVTAFRDLSDRDDFRAVWDFESAGALGGTRELGLRDVSTGLTVTRSESEFFEEVEEVVEARKKGDVDSITVWTIDKERQMGQLLYHGVDGIMTNDVKELYAIWRLTL
jgi:glycerophosphoryl diester phosphodiesterase